jgi:putative transposase
MQYRDSIFGRLLKPISRRQFGSSVERHGADAYDKSFDSFSHLVALLYAQLGGIRSLRGLEAAWNAHSHHHYHLGVGPLARSTLSDANARRPVALFAETFSRLSGLADRALRREGAHMLRLIDATPIPLNELVDWAEWNGRTRGLKLHVVYDPSTDHPRQIAITPSTVNDVQFGRQQPVEPGATYAFDKAYCDYSWWTRISQGGAFFVTRAKRNVRYKITRRRPMKKRKGDGFTVLADHEVRLASQGRAKLPITLRRLRIKRETGGMLTIITNDLVRPAVEIAAVYKTRWQIELLFRWLKQHLAIRRFLGRSENAIRLQIVAAMIAYLLLRIAARESRLKMPAIRFAELVASCLFVRKPIAKIDKPPDVNPSKPRPRFDFNQLELKYA